MSTVLMVRSRTLHKLENLGGAGLRARRNHSGQRRPPHQKMVRDKIDSSSGFQPKDHFERYSI